MSRKPRIWVRTCRMSINSISTPCAGGPRSARDLALEEEHRDERVDRERFGQRRDDDHGELDLAGRLGLTPDRLHGAAADAAESDARADRRESDADRKAPTECRVEIHRQPPFLVSGRAAPPPR